MTSILKTDFAKRIICAVAALVMAFSAHLAIASDAQAYWSRLCSGYGSVYHSHYASGLTYYMYTYSFRSNGYPWMEYWTWDKNNGWMYKGWAWC